MQVQDLAVAPTNFKKPHPFRLPEFQVHPVGNHLANPHQVSLPEPLQPFFRGLGKFRVDDGTGVEEAGIVVIQLERLFVSAVYVLLGVSENSLPQVEHNAGHTAFFQKGDGLGNAGKITFGLVPL